MDSEPEEEPAAVTVSRSLPDSAAPGSSFTVTLTMAVYGKQPPAAGILEKHPSAWKISNVSDDGITKYNPYRIEWLFWSLGNPVKNRSITYTITVPEYYRGDAVFTGTLHVKDDQPIAGDSIVRITE
ncbi:MAG: hypothetical protein JW724_06490 [Candidatus Altiarchaeota archaeon]|nr:hypothetical protein [Candidatus Altiarchaeota archaeon]